MNLFVILEGMLFRGLEKAKNQVRTFFTEESALKSSIREAQKTTEMFREYVLLKGSERSVPILALFYQTARAVLEEFKNGKPTEMQVGMFCEIMEDAGTEAIRYLDGDVSPAELSNTLHAKRELLSLIYKEMRKKALSSHPPLHIV
ncbi:MAG: hypothetical protein WD003_02570 [Candidatus Paceibacterota bacterium]